MTFVVERITSLWYVIDWNAANGKSLLHTLWFWGSPRKPNDEIGCRYLSARTDFILYIGAGLGYHLAGQGSDSLQALAAMVEAVDFVSYQLQS